MLVSAMGVAGAGEWFRYTGNGRFSVEMPGQPKLSREILTTSRGRVPMISADYGDYRVTYCDFDFIPTDPLLDGARDRILKTTGAKVREEHVLVHEDYIERRMIMDLPEEGLAEIVVLVLVPKSRRLIEAIYVGDKGTETSANVRRFIESVRVER
jgi:hypothetical protein